MAPQGFTGRPDACQVFVGGCAHLQDNLLIGGEAVCIGCFQRLTPDGGGDDQSLLAGDGRDQFTEAFSCFLRYTDNCVTMPKRPLEPDEEEQPTLDLRMSRVLDVTDIVHCQYAMLGSNERQYVMNISCNVGDIGLNLKRGPTVLKHRKEPAGGPRHNRSRRLHGRRRNRLHADVDGFKTAFDAVVGVCAGVAHEPCDRRFHG